MDLVLLYRTYQTIFKQITYLCTQTYTMEIHGADPVLMISPGCRSGPRWINKQFHLFGCVSCTCSNINKNKYSFVLSAVEVFLYRYIRCLLHTTSTYSCDRKLSILLAAVAINYFHFKLCVSISSRYAHIQVRGGTRTRDTI